MTRYLGIDPGFDHCGYAVITDELGIVEYDVIQTNKEWSYWKRLETIYVSICDVITGCRVQVAGVEKPFVGKNLRYGVEVAGVWGVIGLAIRLNGCEYMELTTTQVKAAVANGRASKEEVRHGVMLILNMDVPPKYDDITDAFAAAICTRDRWNLAETVKEGS